MIATVIELNYQRSKSQCAFASAPVEYRTHPVFFGLLLSRTSLSTLACWFSSCRDRGVRRGIHQVRFSKLPSHATILAFFCCVWSLCICRVLHSARFYFDDGGDSALRHAEKQTENRFPCICSTLNIDITSLRIINSASIICQTSCTSIITTSRFHDSGTQPSNT